MTTDLARLADRAGRDLAEASPQDILRWALDRFPSKFAIASSMGDSVLVHMASEIQPGVPVVFLDTGYHFSETLATRDAVATTYPVQLLSITPKQTVAEQDATYGPALYERNPDLCCELRKVRPLEQALGPFDAWASGLRRDESPARADTQVVEWDARRGKVKVNPLAAWTQADVDDYAATHGVLVNPLLFDGYASIGCGPCTRRVAAWEDPRAGRWSGLTKTECGIHA